MSSVAKLGSTMWVFGVSNNGGVSGVLGVRCERDDGLRRKRKTCVDSSASSPTSPIAVGAGGSFLLCIGGGGNGGNLPFPNGSGVGSMLRRSNGRSCAGVLGGPSGLA